jgi:hypothetical protein
MRAIFYHLVRSPRKLVRVGHKRTQRRIRRDLLVIKLALAQEKQETREMLAVYRKFTKGEASKVEMKAANEQLVDVMKGLGIGIFATLPFAPITIPFIIKLGKRFGIDVLPSAFYEKDKKVNIEITDIQVTDKTPTKDLFDQS